MSDYYVLNENNDPVAVSDVMEWARMFENGDRRRVAHTVIGEASISTVFLGVDHSHGHGPPILFETMIFGGEHDQHQDRCSTWKGAEAMHETACSLVRGNSAK